MIPSFRLQFDEDEVPEFLAHAERVLRSGRLILGPYTEAIESRMAEVTGTKHAVAVSSGTSALEIVFRALDAAGRKVLVPANTNFATAAAAVYAGATVELYDNGLYPDMADLTARIDDATAAVVVVHIGGHLSPDLPRLVELCERRGVRVVEDAAHAHGAMLHGRPAGGLAHVAAFSFYPTKVVTTGEGGMITTDLAEVAARARSYRDQGKDATGVLHERWGNSWRMGELNAAMGLVRIGRAARDGARLREVLGRYRGALDGVGGLAFPGHEEGMAPSGYKSIAVLPAGVDRAALKAGLLAEGVQLGREVYEVPLHRQPVFADAHGTDALRMADDFCDRHVCLPLWRQIEDADVERVITAVAEALTR